MSIETATTIPCEGCGRQQPFTVWESLNVTLDPDRKQQLISGKLTECICDSCGWTTQVIYPLLYQDIQQQVMVYLLPGSQKDLPPQLADIPVKSMTSYRFRRVSSRNELIEKIFIFDHQLDDRVMESFKWILQQQSLEGPHPLPGPVYFVDRAKSEEGTEVLRFEHVQCGKAECFQLPFAAYQDVAEAVQEFLTSGQEAAAPWLRVDLQYGRDLVQRPG